MPKKVGISRKKKVFVDIKDKRGNFGR